jgi:hypothetical protein
MSLVRRYYCLGLEVGERRKIVTSSITLVEDAVVTAIQTADVGCFKFHAITLVYNDDRYPLEIGSNGWFLARQGATLEFSYERVGKNTPPNTLLQIGVIVWEDAQPAAKNEGEALSLIAHAAWIATGHETDLEPAPPTLRDSALQHEVSE